MSDSLSSLPKAVLEAAKLAAVALGIARPELGEELRHDAAVTQAVEGEAPVGERGVLAERDHGFDHAAQLLCLGESSLNDLVHQKRDGHVSQHRQAMAAGPVELPESVAGADGSLCPIHAVP